MTSRKVKKYIKAQQKARRQAQREQRYPQEGRPLAPQKDRAGKAARAAAALLGVGLVAAGMGSAAMGLAGEDDEQTALLEPHAVAGPEVTERLTCPTVPGSPDSLSEQGVVEYTEPDDSVTAGTFAVVFAAHNGEFPSAEWVALDDEGRGDSETLITSDERDDDSDGPLVGRPLIRGEFDAGEAVPLVEVDPLAGRSPSRAPVSAAGFVYSADSGPITGLTAGMCDAPARSQLFLGPETGSGATSLLTLSNPHSRDATAEVTTLGAEGETGALGSTTVLVPQHSVRTVNVAGLTDADADLAVHVQASGAPVAGHLQSARSTGGSGLGVEMLASQQEPQEQHNVLGVPAGAEEDPQMWFYVPGEENVTVELQVFGPDGQVESDTPGVFTLEPGVVSTAGLHGLPSGSYDVVLNSDHPTFAAVRSAGDGEPLTVEVELEPEVDPITGEELDAETQQEETDPLADFSWSDAAEPLDAGSGVVLPTGYPTDLRLFAPPTAEQTEVTYRLFDSQGQRTDDVVQQVNPGASNEVPYDDLVEQAQSAGLEDLSAVVIADSAGEVYGGTITRDDAGGLTTDQLVPLSPSAQYVPLRLEP